MGEIREHELGEQKNSQEGQEGAPKKKRIIAVFRPQNSRSGMMPRRQGQKNEGGKEKPAHPIQRKRSPEAGKAAGAEQRGQRKPAAKAAAPRPAAPKAEQRPAAPKPRVHFRGALTGSR